MRRRWIVGAVAFGMMMGMGHGAARGDVGDIDDGGMVAAADVAEAAAGAVVKVPAATATSAGTAARRTMDATAVGPARVVVEGVAGAAGSRGGRALIPEPEVVAVLSLLLGPLLLARQRERERGAGPHEKKVLEGGFE